MKKIVMAVLALAALVSCAKEEQGQVPREETAEEETVDHSVVQGEAVVRFSDEMLSLIESDLGQGKVVTRSMGLNQVLDEIGISSIRRLFPDAGEFEPRTRREGLHRWYIVTFKTDVPQTRAAAQLGGVSGIECVESRPVIVRTGFNDPQLSSQWGFIGGNGCDINVSAIWSGYTTGDPGVVVAVVDEGVEITHEDLAANCGTKHHSFISGSGSVVAGNHGTHVAGTIAAVNNNGIGVCGVAGGNAAAGQSGVTIMSCEILRDIVDGGETKTLNGSSSEAIKWAADNGAVICQNSWGYSYDKDGDGKLNDEEKKAALAGKISSSDKAAVDYFIKYAGCDNEGNQLPDSPMKGGLVVFAAGNENITNGAPANYEPVIAVGAITSDGSKAYYSNYGDFVDIAAPGSSIYSTKVGGQYGSLSGTSMACPHVSGVAALVASYFGGPGFSCDELKERLLGSKKTEGIPASVGGLVNAVGAMTYRGDYVPSKVTDLRVTSVSNSFTASWTVTGDADGHPAYGYAVLYGKDKDAVAAADPLDGTKDGVTVTYSVPNLPVGESYSVSFEALDFSTTYYVKVVGQSYGRTFGESSDVISFVSGANNPPVIEINLDGALTLKSHETEIVNVSVVDPDGHAFTFAYTSGSEADVFSGLNDGKGAITITACDAEPGSYTAELVVTDSYGGSSSVKIDYTLLENTPPRKIKDMEDMFFTAVGEEFTLNTADYFEDPDGETLKYEITVDNSKVAHVAQNVDRIIGTILQYGAASVTVTAYDARRAEVSTSFRILAREASIEYAAYPNPVKDVLNIATGAELADVHVRIVSMTGGTVFDGTLRASAFEPAVIDLSDCAPGRYSATIKIDSKEYKQTIVKK